MLEINIVTNEDAFGGLIKILGTAKERISEIEDISTEPPKLKSKVEKQTKK